MIGQWKLEISEKGGVASIWGPRKDGNARLSDGRGLIAQVDLATLETKSRISYPEIDQESLSYARLMAASPDLLAACQLQEAAEEFNCNKCENCFGEGEPEACEVCFPKFDDARVARRAAIARAEGRDAQPETKTDDE